MLSAILKVSEYFMSEKKELEYEVIIIPTEGKEVRLTVKTADPFNLKDELKAEYGEDSIISFHNPDAANRLR